MSMKILLVVDYVPHVDIMESFLKKAGFDVKVTEDRDALLPDNIAIFLELQRNSRQHGNKSQPEGDRGPGFVRQGLNDRYQESDHHQREAQALRLVGITFLVLAAWVGYESITSLIAREAPSASYVGITIAGLSLVVMPWLAFRKRRVAAQIGSRALASDSRQTSLCAYLSAIVLMGLSLNAVLGWWWADGVAALLMVPIIVSEGIEALRGERCEC